MKRLILLFLFIPTLVWATPPSRIFTYNSGSTINPSEVTANEDAIFNYLNNLSATIADDAVTTTKILDGTIVNADISTNAGITFGKLAGSIPDSKLDQIISTGKVAATALPGVTLPSGAVFFMMSGNCPSGTTDVSVTYSNKFLKINATAGTSGGVVLTGTSDSHTLTTGEMPSHTHNVKGGTSAGGGGFATVAASANDNDRISDAAGSGGGHTHTLSSATTLEPSSITMKMCQCN